MARHLIVADIHSNLEAFASVLASATAQGEIGQVWCLGDIVGYGPDPSACISLLREHLCIVVAGNHDLAAINETDMSDFNDAALAAARWTAEHLSDEDRLFLRSMPRKAVSGDFTLVHGSPRDPLREYILSAVEAEENMKDFGTRYCLIGHSHVPLFFRQVGGETLFNLLPRSLALGKGRFIINPGGVGQPRDRDPRASFAILDTQTNTLRHYRVRYDIKTTQQKILSAGLPPVLAERLSYGW